MLHVQVLLYTIFYFIMEFKDFLLENNPGLHFIKYKLVS